MEQDKDILLETLEIIKEKTIPSEMPNFYPFSFFEIDHTSKEGIQNYFKMKEEYFHSLKIRKGISSFEFRGQVIKMMGFAYVSWRWINPFAEWIGERKVLEVMAGKGTIAYALKQKNINILPTDNFSWTDRLGEDTWTEVIELDALESIEKYGKKSDILLMSWIPCGDPIGYQCLKKFH